MGPIGLFLQRCFDGLANGAIYSSLALALVIVYRSTGLLNTAQGELATASTYIGLVLHTPATPALAGTGLATTLVPWAPWPLWLSILGGMVAGAAMGAVVERYVIRRVAGGTGFSVVSASVGLLLLINGLTEYLWKPVVRGYEPLFPNDASGLPAPGAVAAALHHHRHLDHDPGRGGTALRGAHPNEDGSRLPRRVLQPGGQRIDGHSRRSGDHRRVGAGRCDRGVGRGVSGA